MMKTKEPVVVPDAGDMDDETFIMHLEKRHARDCGFENSPISRRAMEAWLPVYRAFHERLHRLAVPGQYDHEHDW